MARNGTKPSLLVPKRGRKSTRDNIVIERRLAAAPYKNILAHPLRKAQYMETCSLMVPDGPPCTRLASPYNSVKPATPVPRKVKTYKLASNRPAIAICRYTRTIVHLHRRSPAKIVRWRTKTRGPVSKYPSYGPGTPGRYSSANSAVASNTKTYGRSICTEIDPCPLSQIHTTPSPHYNRTTTNQLVHILTPKLPTRKPKNPPANVHKIVTPPRRKGINRE